MDIVMYVAIPEVLAVKVHYAMTCPSVDRMALVNPVVWIVKLAAKEVHVDWIGLSVDQMVYAMSVEGVGHPVVMATSAQKVTSADWMDNALHVEGMTKFVAKGRNVTKG
jgi:hypothetical protein